MVWLQFFSYLFKFIDSLLEETITYFSSHLDQEFFETFSTKVSPIPTQGPIPKTNRIVPIPTTPPRSHPEITAKSSIIVLIAGSEEFVCFCRPIMRPSLGPGPKLLHRYIPLPRPTTRIPKQA